MLIFYAKIKDKIFEIDSRPSDAIALALRLGIKIFINERLLEKKKEEIISCF